MPTLRSVRRALARIAVVTTVAAGLACGSDGDDGTTNPPPVTKPAARSLHRMAYDEARQEVIVFGGMIGTTPTAETWAYNGTTWTRKATAGPPPVVEPLMGYDPARQRVVLFDSEQRVTWEWDGTAWSQRATGGPPARRHAAGGVDRRRNRFIVHGGLTAADVTLTDSWEWDGTTWTQRAATTPTARDLPSQIVYSDARQAAAMVVSQQSAGSQNARPSELWLWDGSAWSAAGTGSPPLSPPAILGSLGAQGLVMLRDTGTAFETWRFDGQQWARVDTPSPTYRFFTAVASDAQRGRIYLFGGQTAAGARDDLWTFDGTRWTEVR